MTRVPNAIRLLTSVLLMTLFGFAGCAPLIGDDCTNSLDCSVNGDRVCDRAQVDGYCTVQNCEKNTCPEDESTCVEFRIELPRLATSWCMATCESNSDCREPNYECVTAAEEGARNLDSPEIRFCAAKAPQSR